MSDLTIKQNENKFIEFTIRDNDGNPFTLTSMVATIQVQKYGQSTLILSAACEITSAANGELRWNYNSALSVGEYKAEIEVTTDAALVYITPSFDVDIIASLPD
jgi:hypothetical protein